MSDTFNTIVSNWQGVDDTPTAGSDNLVKSGGVQNELALGAVYDVSAKNPTAGPNNDGKWESLSALLSDANLNTLIPTSVRKGGMSIRFVKTSDNKYVQHRLISNVWSVNVNNWTESLMSKNGSSSDIDFSDENGNVILSVIDGYVVTKNFNSKKINNIPPKTIICVGDSITQGQTGYNPINSATVYAAYPIYLSEMLGSKANVINLGAGGQSTTEILARMGWEGIKIVNGFTLYGNQTESELTSTVKSVGACNLISTFDGRILNQFLQASQGHPECVEQMTTVYIRNIECTLRADLQNAKLYIKRKDAVAYDVTIRDGEQLSFMDKGSDPDAIYLICCGYNGDTPTLTNDEYAEKIVNAVSRITSGKYLILGLSVYDAAHEEYITGRNTVLRKYFGNRFLDIHNYLSSYESFYDQGLTPTTDADISQERATQGVISDVAAITAGYKPSTYWRDAYIGGSVDSIHCNLFGYTAMATIIKTKMSQLGWI